MTNSKTGGMPEDLVPGYALKSDNFGNLWDFLLDDPLDTRFQSHLAHGATAAGPGQPYFDHRPIDLYQLDAPAVSLQHGSYLGKGLLDFFTHLFPPLKIIISSNHVGAR